MSKTMGAPVAMDRHADLERSYRAVGDRTWLAADLTEPNLEVSRALFTPDSLVGGGRPRPKDLEVVALLGGLPFDEQFTDKLSRVQRAIGAVIGERLHYWVEPANLGVEFCVFKWPNDPWQTEWVDAIGKVLATVRQSAFRFDIAGIQVNPDGCVVAKGFDAGSGLFRIREHVTSRIPFIPKRQSGWAHAPLGRILEPLGAQTFSKLSDLMNRLSHQSVASTEIDSLLLVHETRWYMEEKTVLSKHRLTQGVSR